MIDIEDGPYHITKWEKHQNVEGMEKVRLQTNERVKKHRVKEKNKLETLPSNATVTLQVTQCNATELELDLELDLDQEIPLKDTATAAPNPFAIYQSEGFGMLTDVTGQKIGDMIDDFGEPWVCEAMKEASYYGKRNLPYVKSILNRYRTSGIDEPWKQEKAGDNSGGTKENVQQGGSTFNDKPSQVGKSGVLPSKWFKYDENGDIQVSGL